MVEETVWWMQGAVAIGLYLAGWTVLFLLAKRFNLEEKGLKVGPLYFVYKTTLLNRTLGRFARKMRRVWRVFFSMGAAVGVGMLILIVFQLVRNAFNLVYRTREAGPVQVLLPIPGLTMRWEIFPYVIVALCVLVITHEGAHAIASLVEGISLKSSGVFLAAAIPGGLVELDDEKLDKSPYSTQLRVFAAGSSANMAVSLIFLLLMANFALTISPFYTIVPSGVLVGGTTNGYPAEIAGIQAGDIIQGIDETRIANLDGLRAYMAQVKPGSTVTISTSRGELGLVTAPDPNNGTHAVLGVTQLTDHIVYSPKLSFLSPDLPRQLYNVQFWIYFVTVNVALINMLPLFPLDGDRFLIALLGSLGVRNGKMIRSAMSAFSFAILALNLVLSYSMFGFVKI